MTALCVPTTEASLQPCGILEPGVWHGVGAPVNMPSIEPTDCKSSQTPSPNILFHQQRHGDPKPQMELTAKLGLGPKCLDPLSESVPSHGQGGERLLMGQNLAH